MRILVTAGPTREFIDPVRFISNRSSGRMGYAIAAEARARGHETTLVSGPVAIQAPAHVHLVKVVSADDMRAAVLRNIGGCDALIMAAAVADWKPAERGATKLKKRLTSPELRLAPTPDILLEVKALKGKRLHVGFAAETDSLESEAGRKLQEKGLDLIVANDVSRSDAGFDVETNQVLLLAADGSREQLPLLPKRQVAARIVEWVEQHAPAGAGVPAVEEDRLARLAAGERLARQMRFMVEIDKLKSIARRTLLMDGSRYENDAEHSWHLAVMALVLAEHTNAPSLDLGRVIRMVLVHDIVEIDAGDTYCYDDAAHSGKDERERAAADRLFSLLPKDQAAELRGLWEEFEARRTPEARFAAALDRLQPLMHNYWTDGVVWRQHGVGSGKVTDRNRHVGDGSRTLWEFAESLIRDAVERGYLER